MTGPWIGRALRLRKSRLLSTEAGSSNCSPADAGVNEVAAKARHAVVIAILRERTVIS